MIFPSTWSHSTQTGSCALPENRFHTSFLQVVAKYIRKSQLRIQDGVFRYIYTYVHSTVLCFQSTLVGLRQVSGYAQPLVQNINKFIYVFLSLLLWVNSFSNAIHSFFHYKVSLSKLLIQGTFKFQYASFKIIIACTVIQIYYCALCLIYHMTN